MTLLKYYVRVISICLIIICTTLGYIDSVTLYDTISYDGLVTGVPDKW